MESCGWDGYGFTRLERILGVRGSTAGAFKTTTTEVWWADRNWNLEGNARLFCSSLLRLQFRTMHASRRSRGLWYDDVV